MSQLQTQRTATFNTQQMIRFSQRMREKELNGELTRKLSALKSIRMIIDSTKLT